MKKLLTFLALVSCATHAENNEAFVFDVFGGQYQTHIDRPIKSTGEISCDIELTGIYENQKWASVIKLVLSSNDEKHSAQVMYQPNKGFNRFIIARYENNEPVYQTYFLELLPASSKVTISLKWQDDGVIEYAGGDGLGQKGSGYITSSGKELEKLKLSLSGMKGSISCAEKDK